MDKVGLFKNFLRKFEEQDPGLIEAVEKGFSALYESTEEKVEEIAASLSLKPSGEESTPEKALPPVEKANIEDEVDIDATKDAGGVSPEARLQMEKENR